MAEDFEGLSETSDVNTHFEFPTRDTDEVGESSSFGNADEDEADPLEKDTNGLPGRIQYLEHEVLRLEEELESLRGDFRLLKRKCRIMDPEGEAYQAIIEKSIVKLLDQPKWESFRPNTPAESSEAWGQATAKGIFEPILVRRVKQQSSMFQSRTQILSDVKGSRPCPARVKAKRMKSLRESPEPLDDDDANDSDYHVPSEKPSNLKNVKPASTSASLPSKRIVVVESPKKDGNRRVVVVKNLAGNARPNVPRVPDSILLSHEEEGGVETPVTLIPSAIITKDKRVIRAGDVSVILDEEEDYVEENKKVVRVKRERGPTSPKKYTRRRIQCEHCPSTCRDKYDMAKHVRKHTGEKPYSCAFCETRFSQMHHMYNHVKKYHDS